MKRIKRIYVLGFVLFMLGTQVINGYSGSGQMKAQAVTVSPSAEIAKKTLYVKGASYTIKLKNVSSKATVTYKTSKKSVATVTSKGVVKPIGKGSTTITVTIKQNKKTYTVKIAITVKNPSVSITESVTSLAAGDRLTLTAKANGLKNPTIVWDSSDAKVAAIGKKTGKVTAKSAGKV